MKPAILTRQIEGLQDLSYEATGMVHTVGGEAISICCEQGKVKRVETDTELDTTNDEDMAIQAGIADVCRRALGIHLGK